MVLLVELSEPLGRVPPLSVGDVDAVAYWIVEEPSITMPLGPALIVWPPMVIGGPETYIVWVPTTMPVDPAALVVGIMAKPVVEAPLSPPLPPP